MYISLYISYRVSLTKFLCIVHVDLLSIQVTPTSLTIGETGTAQFTAIASGVNMNNFTYQWKKRGSDSLLNKVSGINGTVLTIPNVLESDEGQYYCIVTNEWGRSVESNNGNLTIEGTYFNNFKLYLNIFSK